MRMKLQRILPLGGTVATVAALAFVISCGEASGAAVPPPTLLPLNQVVVPEPPNLYQFVKNKQAAIRLGKAFFWDMQVGSDGIMACATCHYAAGADCRRKNTVNPGTRGGDTHFEVVSGPNETIQPEAFPFHLRGNPDFQLPNDVLRDSNDVVGSQGIRLTQFLGITPGSAVDQGTPIPDPVFSVNGVNVRKVSPRNAPTVINAVFNFSSLWDGRGHFAFNGETPFGPLDQNAGVWFSENGALVKRKVEIHFGSLASQATDPPVDEREMSFKGRTFCDIARKLLTLPPLGKQFVHPGDSVLGPWSRATLTTSGNLTGNRGLRQTYGEMIRAAFVDNLWNSVRITPSGDTQLEANFALFWGLAIQLYEATLVSDQSPFDRFLGGDQSALSALQQEGFNIFFGAGRCDLCHGGSEMTNASVSRAAFLTNADNRLMEQVPMASGRKVVYDEGFTNTAVRPTSEDIGRGGTADFINPLTGQEFPLSFVRLAGLQALGKLPFSTPVLPFFLTPDFPTGADGFFKIPGLRNVELTAPYMHNGGMLTLDEVVDFYTRGGDFPTANRDNLDINIIQIDTMQYAPEKMAELIAFLKSFTDERVRNESAPFDHPEIMIPEGDPEILNRIPARNAEGVAAPAAGFSLDPVVTPTDLTSQTISGTREPTTTVQVRLNGGPPLAAATPSGGTWSAALTGMVNGVNTIEITATDPETGMTTLTATIRVEALPPVLVVDPVVSPASAATQLVTGTRGPGSAIVFRVNGSPPTSASTPTETTWNALLTGLQEGANTVTFTATDPVSGLSTTVSTAILVDLTAPALTLKPVTTPTRNPAQKISGTVEAGIVPAVSVTSGGTGPMTVTGSTWTTDITGMAAGTNTVTVTATDTAGNRTTVTGTILVDQAPPVDGTLTATPEAGGISLAWSGFSDAGSGIRSYWLVYAPGTPPANCASGTVLYPLGDGSYTHTGVGEGTYHYRICAVDNVGNTSPGAFASASAGGGSAGPVGSIRIDGGKPFTTSTSRKVTLSLQATSAAGISAMCVSNAPACTKWTPYAPVREWTLEKGDGTKTVYVRYRDGGGREHAAPYSASIILDTKPPGLTLDPVPKPAGGSVTLTGTVEQGASVNVAFGTASIEAAVSGTSWNCTVSGLAAGSNKVVLTATDPAGNVSKKKTAKVAYRP